MRLFFLQASVPLTKTYTKTASGEILKTPYPMTWEFTSHETEVTDLIQFEAALRKHSGMGNCLIKGVLHKSLLNESRAGSTSTNDTP